MSDFEYDAFISYRHMPFDEQWAKWLIRVLETFRTPRTLRRQGLPPGIGRVFRDDDELSASANISIPILDALSKSRFLIVICSKTTRFSKWIDEEVRYFKKKRGADNIIILLTEGTPGTSYPSGLNNEKLDDNMRSQPLAVDVRSSDDSLTPYQKNRAALKIVAAILGVSFDALYARATRRDKTRLVASVSAFLLVLVTLMVVVGQSVYAWQNVVNNANDTIISNIELTEHRGELLESIWNLERSVRQHMVFLTSDSFGLIEQDATIAADRLSSIQQITGHNIDANSLAGCISFDAMEQRSLSWAGRASEHWAGRGSDPSTDMKSFFVECQNHVYEYTISLNNYIQDTMDQLQLQTASAKRTMFLNILVVLPLLAAGSIAFVLTVISRQLKA